MTTPWIETLDQYEVQFVTNFMSPFARIILRATCRYGNEVIERGERITNAKMLISATTYGHKDLCFTAKEWGRKVSPGLDFDEMIERAAEYGHRDLCDLARRIGEEGLRYYSTIVFRRTKNGGSKVPSSRILSSLRVTSSLCLVSPIVVLARQKNGPNVTTRNQKQPGDRWCSTRINMIDGTSGTTPCPMFSIGLIHDRRLQGSFYINKSYGTRYLVPPRGGWKSILPVPPPPPCPACPMIFLYISKSSIRVSIVYGDYRKHGTGGLSHPVPCFYAIFFSLCKDQ